MSIWLPQLAIDRWRLSERPDCEGGRGDDHPLVLVTETTLGPCVCAVNRAGAAAGARIGETLSRVRALCPDIAVQPGDPAGDLEFLKGIALWARQWGPTSAIDAPDAVLVDVTAVAHLFGGEGALLADARRRFAKRGLKIRLAIAPTAGAAWALSHYGPAQAILEPDDNIAKRLGALPVAALRIDADVLQVLKRLGLKRLSDLTTRFGKANGRDALHRRFHTLRSPDANPLRRLDQMLGKVPEPLLPVASRQIFFVQRRLLEPIRHRNLLDRVLVDLAGDMACVLETAGQGARKLELGLWRIDGTVIERQVELAAPSRDPAHIGRLFDNRLDDVDAGFGIEIVHLRASWTESLTQKQSDFQAAEKRGISLATFIDRLAVRLGKDAVRRPALCHSHIPERAQRWQPPFDPEPLSQGELALHVRPLKLLEWPEKISVLYATPDGYPKAFRWRGAVHEVARVEGPERIAPEWWCERKSARLRDYFRVEDGEGRRYWIYRLGILEDGRGGLPDWFLQGLCA